MEFPLFRCLACANRTRMESGCAPIRLGSAPGSVEYLGRPIGGIRAHPRSIGDGPIMNWYAGWTMILTAFVTGAILGLFFYREDFLGGYASFRRRILRLGHIALAALGTINVVYSLS